MNKKCWIGKSEHTIVLFYGELGYNISPNFQYPKEYIGGWGQHNFKDITKEYLNNTKIRVESEEHSKFIQELAFSVGIGWKGNSFKLNDNGGYKICHLYLKNRYLTYTGQSDEDFFKEEEMKEVFLPLPPNYDKEVESEIKAQNNSTEVEIYWNEPLKNDYGKVELCLPFSLMDQDIYVCMEDKTSYVVDRITGLPVAKYLDEGFNVHNDISNYRKVELIVGKDIAAKLKEEGLINVD